MVVAALILLFIALIYLGDRVGQLERQVRQLMEGKSGATSDKSRLPPIPVPRAPESSSTITPAPRPDVYTGVAPSVPRATDSQGLEFKFGSQIFTIVGAVALLFGIGFFLRFAFANNLITETARVVMGLLAGVVLLVTGEVARRKYALYGQILCGLGVGVLYLSLYAAYNFYALLYQPTAFFGMILVTILGMGMAVRYDSRALAFMAVIGGFLTPLLLSTGENQPHALFPYLALLDVGVLAVSAWRRWRELSLLSFFGTVLIFIGWQSSFGDVTSLTVVQSYATLFWAIFLVLPLVQFFVLETPKDNGDLWLIVANPMWYLSISYVVLKPDYQPLLAVLTASLALIYLALAYAFSQYEKAPQRFAQFFTNIGFVLLVLVVPIQFHQHWITIGWAAESLALAYLSYQLRSPGIRGLSYLVAVMALLRFVLIDMVIPVSTPIFNTHVFVFIVVLLCLLATNILHWVKREAGSADDAMARTLLAVATLFLLVWVPTAEVRTFFANYWIPAVWSVGGIIAVLAGLGLRDVLVRGAGYLLLMGATLQVFLVNTELTEATYALLFNGRVFAGLFTVVALGLAAYIVRETPEEYLVPDERRMMPKVMASGVNVLLFWLLSWEIVDYYKYVAARAGGEAVTYYRSVQRAVLTVGWIVYAIILLVIGIVMKSAVARLTSLVVFVLAILKVFLYDALSLSDYYRFVSFLALGCLLLLTGFLYYRYEERIAGFLRAS